MPSASLIKEFEQLVGKENVFSSEADRQSYAYDAAVLKPMIPSLVVRPTEVEQLGQVVKRCSLLIRGTSIWRFLKMYITHR